MYNTIERHIADLEKAIASLTRRYETQLVRQESVCYVRASMRRSTKDYFPVNRF